MRYFPIMGLRLVRTPISALALVLVPLVTACAASPVMQAAEKGDYATMQNEIGARQKAGSLTNAEARELAIVVLRHELDAAKGDDVVKRIREARACSPELQASLEKRMATKDAGGAEAALVLYEDGKLEGAEAREHTDAPDDAWRAVGASALVRDLDAPRRRQAMVDPSPRVRRAAISASALAGDQGDANVLFETARVDPDPFVRTYALRGLALLGGDRGPDAKGSRIAAEITLRFVDLWNAGDDALKEDVGAQLAISPLYEAGGRERLRMLLGDGHGAGVIAAAAAVTRRPEPTTDADRELRGSAIAILLRTIESGSKRERSHAIATAPLFPETVKVLVKAKDDDDISVRIAVLSRLANVVAERAAAIKALEEIAAKKDEEELSARAKLALASAGDARIQAWIEEDLRSKNPVIRLGAVVSLATMGKAARGAVVMSDDDPSVRTRAACMIAASVRVRH